MGTGLLAAALGVLLLSAACSGSRSATKSSVSATVTPASPVGFSAAGIVNQFRASGLPVGAVLEFNATSDPAHLLGRPHGYTSKVNWVDLAHGDERTGNGVDVADGGSIEVFASAADAEARGATLAAGSPGGTPPAEQEIRSGAVLMRLGPRISAGESRLYEQALANITSLPLEGVTAVARQR